jgi:hypothetical protein
MYVMSMCSLLLMSHTFGLWLPKVAFVFLVEFRTYGLLQRIEMVITCFKGRCFVLDVAYVLKCRCCEDVHLVFEGGGWHDCIDLTYIQGHTQSELSYDHGSDSCQCR